MVTIPLKHKITDPCVRAFCEAAGIYNPAFEILPASTIPAIFNSSGIQVSSHELAIDMGLQVTTVDAALQTVGGAYQIGELIQRRGVAAKDKITAAAKLLALQYEEKARIAEERRPLIEFRERKWKKFLDDTAPNLPPSAQILKFLRGIAYKSQSELEKEIEIPTGTINAWEKLDPPYRKTKLGELTKALTISDTEAERFILLMRPDIIAPPEAEVILRKWLKETIEIQDWEGISFPAFRDKWLATQPSEKQPGILLHNLMEQSGISAYAMDKEIGTCPGIIATYERGIYYPSPYHLGEIACALKKDSPDTLRKCSSENILKFILLSRPSLLPEDPIEQAAIKQWLLERITAEDKEAISFPALSSDMWLNIQPQEKQAGLLLRDIIESRKISRQNIYTTLDIKSLSHWEGGENPITPAKLGPLIDVCLKGKKRILTAERLILKARPDLLPEDMAAQTSVKRWLHKRVKAKDWRNIWLPALDPDKEWLNAQPIRKQAGLLLRDYIEEKKESGEALTKSALSKEVGISESLMSRWISADKCIAPDKVPLIAAGLALSPERREQFETAVTLSNAAILEFRASMKNVSTTTLGATTRANHQGLHLSRDGEECGRS